MTVRLEFIGYCVVLTASLLTVLYRDQLSPGLAGLSITYALSITTALNMLIKAFVDVETNIVAVERCIEFTKIPIEV
jgi:ATP-binding cassette subfamily C (CFTR/MRP) protein 1